MTAPIRVAALCGSLRRASYNAAALRYAIKVAPAGMTITPAEIGDLPHYNDDIRAEGYPPAAGRLRQALSEADAILFVTPEYNFSVPGVLKNALDWASRPPNPPFDSKAVAIMGVSGGQVGTARVQYDLRKMMVFLNAFPVNKPEVFINFAANKFSEDGELTDETAQDLIKKLLISLQQWTLKLRGSA